MLKRRLLNLRKLWLSLLLMVGATAIAVPGIQEIAGTEEDVVEIGTVDQLKDFRDAVNSGNTYADKTVKLTADLDLSSESNWTPIGNLVAYPGQSFNGTFDGDGHTISNLTINDNTPNHAVAGLFGSVVNGTIKNLTVKDVNITSTHYAAGIVAYTSNGPTIENCHVIGGTIKSTPELVGSSYDNGDKVGGIMGYATAGSTINNCTVEGVTISGYRDLGGIVGYSVGSVTNNTVKNVTVTQDLTNGYKNPTPTTIGDIIGRDEGATLSNNTVIKSDPVAQIGETKYETLAEAVAAANAGNVVEIIKAGDYTLPAISKNVTIEGKADGVVSFTHTTAGSVASIPNGATFKNVTFNFGNVNYHGFQHAGTIDMEGCTLNGKLFSYGNMNFTNCTFEQSNEDYHMWVYGGGTVNYTGCAFNGIGKFLNLYQENGSEEHFVNVDNCTFNSSKNNKAALNVKATCGSTLLQYIVNITKCTTNENFPEASTTDALVVLNGLVQVDDRTADGVDKITVTQDGKKIYPLSYVAQIGETKYETLAEAVAAAKSGDTIKLLADLENTGNVSLPAGVTLDGDGKNITGTSAVYINKDGGTVQNVNFKNIHNETSKLSAIYGGNLAGTATITGCTFDNCDWDAIQITPVAGANVVITNNMFSDDVTDNVKQQRYIHVQSKQNVDFSATITENVMPGKLTQEPIGVYYPTDKAKIDLTKNYIESINDVCILVADNNGYAGELVFPAYTTAEKQETYSPVAMIQNGNYAANFYTTLQAAVDAAEAGATIEILKDFTLTTVTTSPSNKYNVNVNKSVTINGNGHVLTSAEGKRAIVLQGAGNNVVLKDITVKSNKAEACLWIADAVNVTLDNSTLDGTKGKTYNQPLTIGQFNSESRVALNIINGSIIKTNDAGTAHYDIIAWHPADITVTNSKLIGWAGVYLKPDAAGSTVKIDGSEMKSTGIKGNSNNFAAIVTESGNNEIEVKDTKISTTPAENTNQSLFVLGGEGNVVKFLGSSTYETTDMTYGPVTHEPGSLVNNKVYFDDATKAAFAKYFTAADGPIISDEKESPVDLYPLVYTPEVYYYWIADGKEEGGYYHFAEPFTNGWLADGEFIQLMKDVSLTEDVACQLESGASFTLTLGDYKVTKGNFSVSLKPGVTVYTDKSASIFSAAEEGYVVKSTKSDNGYTYTVEEADLMFTDANGKVSYKAFSSSVISANGTYKLLKDVTATARIAPTIMPTNIIVDLNGHTLTSTATDYGFLLSRAGTEAKPKTFELVDNSEEKGGKLVVNAEANAAIQVQGKYNEVTIGEGVTVENGCVAILNENDKLTVAGTIIGGDDFAVATNGSTTKNANITIKEGAVLTSNETAMYLPGNEGLVATVEGGSITGAKTGIEVRAGKLTVNGGTISTTAEEYSYTPNGNGTTTKGAAIAVVQHTTVLPTDVQVLGGTLTGLNTIAVVDAQNNNLEGVTVKAKDELVAANTEIPAGYKWASNNDGTSTLAPCTYVAKIGDTQYESLAQAVAAVPTDGTETTITMIADENVVGNAGATISKSQNVKLDLNGKTVTLNVAESKGSQLITNNGTLTIVDSSEEQNGKLTNAAAEGLGVGTWPSNNYATNIITNTGTLNIEAGTIQNTANGSICYAVDNNSTSGNATLNIKGGVLTAVGTAVRQFCNSTTNENNVNISGGEVVTNGSAALWVQLPNSDATKAPKATLNVTGGTLSGNTYAFYDYSYGNSFDATQYNLSGGTFNGGIFSYGANINITDGTYNSWIAIKQAKPSEVSVSGGKFADDVYTYGDNASEGFISGGIFATKTYVDEGETYDCDWMSLLADGYVVSDNTDEATKADYPYAVVNSEEAELVLVHGDPYPVTKTATYKKVTYKRTFQKDRINKYQCWFVPFDYTITGEEGATFYKVHLISATQEANGVVENINTVNINIEKMSAGEKLSANRPYIIKASKADYEFVVEPENGIKLYAPSETSRLHLGTAEFYYDFYGTYDTFKASAGKEWISLTKTNAVAWNSSANASLSSYCWYIKVTSNDDNADYSKISFNFVEVDDDFATNVNGIEENMDEIEGIYSANGVKTENLSKGLNIIKYKNGKTKKIYK